MSFLTFSRLLVTILFPLASFCTAYLYLYTLFHGCGFPPANASAAASLRETFIPSWSSSGVLGEQREHHVAPFRLLVLADPQLEGDSSLPDPEDGFLQRLIRHKGHVFTPNQTKSQRKHAIQTAFKELLLGDIPDLLQGVRKRLDLFGNDYYLAHIFRTLRWWTQPTHITVLGDLLGSQWVTDDEYEARAWRYWNRVFAGGHRLGDQMTALSVEEAAPPDMVGNNPSKAYKWEDHVINIAGNHDIGYAGDVSKARIARFEKNFGRADWDIRFSLPRSNVQKSTSVAPSLHVIVMNDLVLDTPALDPEVQSASYAQLNSIITERSHPVEDDTSFTLLLTHVPLYKPEGACVDAPFFDFHGKDDSEGDYKSGGLKEQNHLSDHVSRSGILEGIYGMTANRNAAGNGKGRKGLILTGHDHEGCDVWHYIPDHGSKITVGQDTKDTESDTWDSVPWRDANISASHTGVREITLRSMMGEFGGNAGLLSLWFDFDKHEWQFDMRMCQLGIQHIWWGIHALDFITICVATLWFLSLCLSSSGSSAAIHVGLDAKVASSKAKSDDVTRGKKLT